MAHDSTGVTFWNWNWRYTRALLRITRMTAAISLVDAFAKQIRYQHFPQQSFRCPAEIRGGLRDQNIQLTDLSP